MDRLPEFEAPLAAVVDEREHKPKIKSDGNPPRRGRREKLTRDRIVDEAFALAASNGLETLTITRLAERLGVGAMTLYGYIKDKDDLIEALAERAMSEIYGNHVIDEAADWRARLNDHFRILRAATRAHPGLAEILFYYGDRLKIQDHAIFGHLESTYSAMTKAGFSDQQAVCAYYVLVVFTVGLTEWQQTTSRDGFPDSWRHLRVNGESYPTLQRVTDSMSIVLTDDQFEFGLGLLLDGLSALLARTA